MSTRMIALVWCAASVSLCAAEDLKRLDWQVEGVTREALVHVPVEARTRPCPVLFAFHGHGGSMRLAAASWGYHRLWPEALVIYMQGLNTPGQLTDPEGKKSGWQKSVGDQNDRDLKFFDAVLATARKTCRVDEKRIFATGHSNGGSFTYLLWAARGDVFAAMAPSGAATLIGNPSGNVLSGLGRLADSARKSAKNLKPKAVFHIAGRDDPLVKFEWQQRTIDQLRKLNGCGEGKASGEHCMLYSSPKGTPVLTYIYPGGHKFPPEAPAMIVKFFRQFPLP
jgi:polyhydroxybutyrate depolymerase